MEKSINNIRTWKKDRWLWYEVVEDNSQSADSNLALKDEIIFV